jgi:hypothetical protein
MSMRARQIVYSDADIAGAKHRTSSDLDDPLEGCALQTVDTPSRAVAAPPFESIKLPKGVIVSYVRTDGSILSTANT